MVLLLPRSWLTLLIQWSVLILLELSAFSTVHWALFSPETSSSPGFRTHTFLFTFYLMGSPFSVFFLLPVFSTEKLINVGVPQRAVLCPICLLFCTYPLRNLLQAHDWDIVLYPQIYISVTLPKPTLMDLTAYGPSTSVYGNHLKHALNWTLYLTAPLPMPQEILLNQLGKYIQNLTTDHYSPTAPISVWATESAQVVIIKYHRLGSLNNRNWFFFPTVLELWNLKSGSLKSWCQHGQVLMSTLFSACRGGTSSLCLHMMDREPWCLFLS